MLRATRRPAEIPAAGALRADRHHGTICPGQSKQRLACSASGRSLLAPIAMDPTFHELRDHRSRTGRLDPEHVAERLADAIAGGRLVAGTRLPTIRAAAERLGVPRATMQQAYRQLADRGLVTSTVGRGTEVVGRGEREPGRLGPRAHAVLEQLAGLADAGASGAATADEDAATVDFRQMLPDPRTFPVDAFADALQAAFGARGVELLGYGDPQGDPELRAWLAAESRQPGEILVTSGAQQGIDLVLRAMANPGDAVVAPVPTYSQLPGALAAHGLGLEALPWNTWGLDLDRVATALAAPGVRILYVMPTFQNPTGLTLDLSTREAVVELCERTDTLILEDEFELGLRFQGEDLPSFGALAPERTATVRTFSKALFPGLRLGWVTAPPAWIAAMAAIRRFADLETSPLTQAAVLEFGRRGHVRTHLARMRDLLRSRHVAAADSLQRHMPGGVRWTSPDGGYALWIELPEGLVAEDVARRAARDGVLVTAGSVFDPARGPGRGLRLSLSRVDEQQIERGIAILAEHVVAAGADRRSAAVVV
jgi:DNA-binding transcriptional MocR family regulator